MRYCKGSYRSVLLVGPLAIKFPRPFFFWQLLRHGREALPHILDALEEIRDEYRTWKKFRAEYLAPVYFSLGFLSVCRRIEGRPATEEEICKIWRELNIKTKGDIWKVNPHNLSDEDSYRKTEKGFVLIDYGSYKDTPMREFLLTWDHVFRELLLDQLSDTGVVKSS